VEFPALGKDKAVNVLGYTHAFVEKKPIEQYTAKHHI
jgi:hypothetical protein